VIGKSKIWVMAGSARNCVVFGQPGVIEELAAQGDGLSSGRIIRRDRNRRES
jgi:hypothetical protein